LHRGFLVSKGKICKRAQSSSEAKSEAPEEGDIRGLDSLLESVVRMLSGEISHSKTPVAFDNPSNAYFKTSQNKTHSQ